MASTLLTGQQIVLAGKEPAYSAANADGHHFPPGANVFLHVKNGAGAPINVTLDMKAKVRGQPVTDLVVAVANGKDKMIGPFHPDLFADPTTGNAYVTFSDVASITVALLTL